MTRSGSTVLLHRRWRSQRGALLAEPLGLLLAVREPSGDDAELRGLPELVVEGIADDDARGLLRSAIRGRLDDQVVERIVAETRGNPLALLESPRGMAPAKLAGGFGLLDRDALTSCIEESFLRQFESLAPQTRRLLLTAAAEPLGDLTLLWHAAERLGVGVDSAAAAEAAGLIELGVRVRFRHPLVRSAVYQAAAPAERRECTVRSPRRRTGKLIPIAVHGTSRMRHPVRTRRSPPSSSTGRTAHRAAAASRLRPPSCSAPPS